MKKKDLDDFRQLLEMELTLLLNNAGISLGELIGSTSDTEPDPLDRATRELSLNNVIRIRSRESRLIRKIRQRLQDIENGTYGICEGCEEPISIGRLKARPVASYCIDCKKRMEALERVIGF